MQRMDSKYVFPRIRPRVLLPLIFIFVCISEIRSKSDLEMNFDVVRCVSDDPDKLLTNLTCYMSKNAKRRTINIFQKFSRKVDRFFIDICVDLPRKRGESFVLLNMTNLDGCQMIANRKQLTLLKIGLASLGRYSNYPKGCPFKKDILYYIRGYRMDMSRFPAFNFETEFRVLWNFVTGGKKIIRGEIVGHSQYKNSRKLFKV